MRSLEDDLASYDRIEILEYLNMLKTAEEFGGKIVRFELHGDTMLVTVRRDGDSQERTYPVDKWGIYVTHDCLRFQHEFLVKPYGKLQITRCKH